MPRARDEKPEGAFGYEGLKLYDLVPRIRPDYVAPVHLAPYVARLEGITGFSGARDCVSICPQVGKSETAFMRAAQLLIEDPKVMIIYAGHSQRFATTQSRKIRDYYLMMGGETGATNKEDEWLTPGGGGLYATSYEGSVTGRKGNWLICDDMTKDAEAADSPIVREKIADWFRAVAGQRLWVGGDVTVIGSRWHPDDLSGYCIARGYNDILIPAIVTDGDGVEHSFWPDVKPLSFFTRLRDPGGPDAMDLREFNAAYMGKPTPSTGTIFGDATYYDELPEGAVPVSIGFDLATSAGKHSDFSAAVVLFYFMGLYYVHDVRTTKQVVTDVEVMIRDVQRDYPGVPIASYVSGQERAIYDLLFYRGIEVQRLPARTSKWQRAQRSGIAWRAGRVLVRRSQSWTKRFARQLAYFTGQDDAHDDMADALVSGHDAHALNAPVGWVTEQGFAFGRSKG